MRSLNSLKLALPIALLSGCASVSVTHVADGDKSDGVHFYEPRPYLLVAAQSKTTPGAGGAPAVTSTEYTSQIIYLPDTTKLYVIKANSGLGTVNASVKLKDGWMLTDFGDQRDSKIPETITALTGVAKEAAALAAQPPEGLYRIDIGADGSVSLAKQAGWK